MNTQANMRRAVVFACVCAIENHQVCFRGVELTETVEVTRIFHAVSFFERMLFGRARLIYEQMTRLTRIRSVRSQSQTFYLRLRNPVWCNLKYSFRFLL